MAALRHHPQHLGLLILTQTDRTRRIIAGSTTTHRILAKLKPGVGVDDNLIKPHDNVFVVPFIVLGDEDYAGKNDAIRVRVSIRVLVRGSGAVARGATAEVGGEYEGGEKYEETQGDGDGVAKADVGDIGGGGGGGGRGHGEKGGGERAFSICRGRGEGIRGVVIFLRGKGWVRISAAAFNTIRFWGETQLSRELQALN
ncbi:hypothetical protein L6164_003931 [Bauhinia variegata]|uniref:Uncharacterized protein n=1 Tax=Bauhinia variegata TaxID=167791 RepID=A0ACB9Q4V6_BAUVA|nr:hypothetical protein L6164_003931 [Bauhinia variegata]